MSITKNKIMAKKDEITIYTNETCPYCKKIKDKLKEKKIKFKEKLTSKNKKEWQNIIQLVAASTVPTIKYKDTYFVAGRDFQSEEQLINIFENYEKCDFPIEEQLLYQMRAMGFNIHQAFTKLDNTLKEINTNYKNLFEDEHESTN